MTANAALHPERPGGSADRERPTDVNDTVRLIRDSWAVVEPQAEDVSRFFYSMLFSLAPATRELFPVNMEVQRSRLLRALVHVVQMVDRPDELTPFLQQLGRDHRKFGVVAEHYEAVGTALLAAIKKYAGDAWNDAVERAWGEAYAVMATTMTDAASKDDGPAWYNGEVVQHERLSWDVAMVRIRPEHPVPYQPGQYVSVEVPQRPRLWRYLSPANPPSDDGTMEFHVRAVPTGWVSRAIVGHAQLGDQWRMGSPMGRLGVDRDSERDVVMLAGGTGLAPMRSIIQDLAQYGNNPEVHLFYGGRTRDDLYELRNLRQVTMSNPWLKVIPVLENDPSAQGAEHGTLAEAVTRYGAWQDHDVLVSGSPEMIRNTVSGMMVAGTPLERIHYDPFTLD